MDVMMEMYPRGEKRTVTSKLSRKVPVQVRDLVPWTYIIPDQNLQLAMLLPSVVDASVHAVICGYILHVHPLKFNPSSVPETNISMWTFIMKVISVTTTDMQSESSSGQVNVEEPSPSTSGNQEQDDEFDFWTDSYASDG
ncbi:hypothetical protein Tco_1105781 [Tanacetum coccineum]